jgi:hypothetical protein
LAERPGPLTREEMTYLRRGGIRHLRDPPVGAPPDRMPKATLGTLESLKPISRRKHAVSLPALNSFCALSMHRLK